MLGGVPEPRCRGHVWAGSTAADRPDRKLLLAKAQERDATIRKLSAMRDGLRHAAAGPARTHMECPASRRLLRKLAAGALPRDKAGARSEPTSWRLWSPACARTLRRARVTARSGSGAA